MNKNRISRIEWYMKIAEVVSERSTCLRAKVGAILVNPINNHIVSVGFNGSPKQALHCIDVGCLMHEGHCIRTIHAELNAVLHLERSYPILHLFTTHQPCLQCVKALVGANVTEVFYKVAYDDKGRDSLLEEISLTFHRIP